MVIKYMLRKPKFPVIINLDGHAVALTARGVSESLTQFELELNGCYDAVDQSCEGFGLYVYADCFVLSPLVVKKKWTKLELIQLYNGRKNNAGEPAYPEKGLSGKKVSKIVSDLAALLLGVK